MPTKRLPDRRPPRRPAPGAPSGGVPIDHAKVIDGFAELAGRAFYEPRQLRCGRCGDVFTFTAAAQKYVHEVRGVPVKMASRGAAYCDACAEARGIANRAARAHARAMRALQDAQEEMARRPDDPEVMLAVVRAHLALLEHEPNARSAARLVALARRASKLDPERVDARYWVGRALLASGDRERAAAALEAFLELAGDRPGNGRWITDAKKRLAALGRG